MGVGQSVVRVLDRFAAGNHGWHGAGYRLPEAPAYGDPEGARGDLRSVEYAWRGRRGESDVRAHRGLRALREPEVSRGPQSGHHMGQVELAVASRLAAVDSDHRSRGV